jgi:hypothetical protein
MFTARSSVFTFCSLFSRAVLCGFGFGPFLFCPISPCFYSLYLRKRVLIALPVQAKLRAGLKGKVRRESVLAGKVSIAQPARFL